MDLIRQAEQRAMLKLHFVAHMQDGCILVTNSGGKTFYVVGLLDDQKTVFVEKTEKSVFWC
jgi:hypothetical protein|tara:strand:+ start:14 stop:196 length:183 start_codon:yes stop_codon:yes gene_type:complete